MRCISWNHHKSPQVCTRHTFQDLHKWIARRQPFTLLTGGRMAGIAGSILREATHGHTTNITQTFSQDLVNTPSPSSPLFKAWDFPQKKTGPNFHAPESGKFFVPRKIRDSKFSNILRQLNTDSNHDSMTHFHPVRKGSFLAQTSGCQSTGIGWYLARPEQLTNPKPALPSTNGT